MTLAKKERKRWRALAKVKPSIPTLVLVKVPPQGILLVYKPDRPRAEGL